MEIYSLGKKFLITDNMQMITKGNKKNNCYQIGDKTEILSQIMQEYSHIKICDKKLVIHSEFYKEYLNKNIKILYDDIERLCEWYGESFVKTLDKVKKLSQDDLVTFFRFYFYSDNDETKRVILNSNIILPKLQEEEEKIKLRKIIALKNK